MVLNIKMWKKLTQIGLDSIIYCGTIHNLVHIIIVDLSIIAFHTHVTDGAVTI